MDVEIRKFTWKYTNTPRLISPNTRQMMQRANVARRHLLEMSEPQQARKETVSVTRPEASRKYETSEKLYQAVSR